MIHNHYTNFLISGAPRVRYSCVLCSLSGLYGLDAALQQVCVLLSVELVLQRYNDISILYVNIQLNLEEYILFILKSSISAHRAGNGKKRSFL